MIEENICLDCGYETAEPDSEYCAECELSYDDE